jgi:hypothetical protein
MDIAAFANGVENLGMRSIFLGQFRILAHAATDA